MLINFLVRTLQSTKIIILDLFAYEKSKKHLKVVYFRKIPVLASQMAQEVKWIFSNMASRPTVHKTGDASMLDQLKSQFF